MFKRFGILVILLAFGLMVGNVSATGSSSVITTLVVTENTSVSISNVNVAGHQDASAGNSGFDSNVRLLSVAKNVTPPVNVSANPNFAIIKLSSMEYIPYETLVLEGIDHNETMYSCVLPKGNAFLYFLQLDEYVQKGKELSVSVPASEDIFGGYTFGTIKTV